MTTFRVIEGGLGGAGKARSSQTAGRTIVNVGDFTFPQIYTALIDGTALVPDGASLRLPDGTVIHDADFDEMSTAGLDRLRAGVASQWRY